MIVWVDDALFAPGAARDVDRLALLRGAARRRHTVAVSEVPADLGYGGGGPRLGAWLGTLGAALRREVELLLDRLRAVSAGAVTQGAGLLAVSDRADVRASARVCAATLDDAVRIVSRPLAVLVENVVHDAAFLRRVLPRAWRERLREWEAQGAVCFEHGGGGTMREILVHFGSAAEGAEPRDLPSPAWCLLHFVVHDHDGERHDRPGEAARAVARACRDLGMATRCHVLSRRNQESYLPRPAIEALVPLRASDPAQQARLLADLAVHFDLPEEERHFRPLPRLGQTDLFKNEFAQPVGWSDRWFADSDQEMTELAERIAAAL